MNERERETRERFSGLVRGLHGYFEHLRLVEQSLPETEDEDDFFYVARAALECARGDHLEPLLRSLGELAAPTASTASAASESGGGGGEETPPPRAREEGA